MPVTHEHVTSRDRNRTWPTDLFVEIELRQGKFNSFPDLLLLHVQPPHICVRDIGLFMSTKHGYRRVGLWRKNIDERVGMTMQSHRG